MKTGRGAVVVLGLFVYACRGGSPPAESDLSEDEGTNDETDDPGQAGRGGNVGAAGRAGGNGGAPSNGGAGSGGGTGDPRGGSAGTGGAAGTAGEAGQAGTTANGGMAGGTSGAGGGGAGGGGAGGGGAGGGGVVVPSGGKTPAEEESAVQLFKSLVTEVESQKEGGRYVMLRLTTDNKATSRLKDEHLARLAGFNALRRLEVNHPNATIEGVQVIKTLPSLEYLGFQYMSNTNGSVGPQFMLTAESHKARLIGLSIKHMFSLGSTVVDQLGTYPKLRYVVLDQESAGAQGVKFLTKNPSIVGLELHRTTITAEQLKQVAQALPNLECLHIKGSSKSAVEDAFRGHPALKVVWATSFSVSLPGVRSVSTGTNAERTGYANLCSVGELRPKP